MFSSSVDSGIKHKWRRGRSEAVASVSEVATRSIDAASKHTPLACAVVPEV
jgi:hypothetical protein